MFDEPYATLLIACLLHFGSSAQVVIQYVNDEGVVQPPQGVVTEDVLAAALTETKQACFDAIEKQALKDTRREEDTIATLQEAIPTEACCCTSARAVW